MTDTPVPSGPVRVRATKKAEFWGRAWPQGASDQSNVRGGRRLKLLSIALGALTILVSASGPGHAGSTMMLTGDAFAPPAFSAFCKRERRLCDSQSGKKVVDLSPDRLQELRAVNADVRKRVRERDDLPATGKTDDWRLATREGDCEDIAIAKKAELMKKGWPASALLLTVARQRFSEEGHTVLTVRTNDGDLILDNLTPSVKDWSRTPYRYFARQSQTQTGKWERIGSGD